MEFTPMTKETADELAEEFMIHGYFRDGFDTLIREIERALGRPLEGLITLGKDRYKGYVRAERSFEVAAQFLQNLVTRTDTDMLLPPHFEPILPVDDNGMIDMGRSMDDLHAPTSALTEGVQIERETAIGICLYVLGWMEAAYGLAAELSTENFPRRRGRPINRARDVVIRIYLGCYEMFMPGPPGHGEQSDCVALCERLLLHYGIEPGEVSQHIKRRLKNLHGRKKRTP